ncbi:hypothetical protein SAMN05660479_02242 [Microbulbifer thermotolerans]|uniref:hypothetical protein n=1 Tax=Microbulbifer thermotolerans TaxID=252514 RepID=UPI0008EC855E|nr:hypothetical protein [Microbulbifer thermotolerans]MCX2794703.1 hypothetical protein [Microbulbifer thermotolerans]MCX2834534.1 hypothetical protein [Microbulbifer thermotolerans]MCX2841735.1 hypothetical protein [Microbulbifer thermotolerans]WKT59525.1 hypothetical protein Q2E61_11530 [Microbulbifer thermotolerans]SFC71162.1 hypothetical protein SAMN05660479_02242 [Microbulbifer thermotolerans]
MLTDRAKKYLATLERVPSIPTREIERILSDNEYPCIPEWLEFHDRFSGYIEPLGLDRAVWGLAHNSPVWMDSFSVDVECDKIEGTFEVVCADVHPSYNYTIDDRGHFFGLASESFEIYVERKAVGFLFSKAGSVRPIRVADIEDEVIGHILNKENLISEATDKFFTYYRYDNYLCVQNSENLSINGWIIV